MDNIHKSLPPEPILPADQKAFAEDIINDIVAGIISYQDAAKELQETVVENKDGEPLSPAGQERVKEEIHNYLKWRMEFIKADNLRMQFIKETYGKEISINKTKRTFKMKIKKSAINRAYGVIVMITIFIHIMLLLNKHKDMAYDRRFEADVPTGTYHFFGGIPHDALNIIYCMYFVYVMLWVLRLVNIKESFGYEK